MTIPAKSSQKSIKLSSLEITNFRAFPQPYKFDFDDKNVVIYGENGSGKSSIFRAIESFFAASENASIDISQYANIFMADQRKLRADTIFDTEANENIQITLTFSQPLIANGQKSYPWNNNGNQPNMNEIREINNSLSLLDYHKLLQLHYIKIKDNETLIDLWPLMHNTILFRFRNPETSNTFQEDYQKITDLMNTTKRSKAQNIELENTIIAYENGFRSIIMKISMTVNHLLSYFFPLNEKQTTNTRIEFLYDDFTIPRPVRPTLRSDIQDPQLFMKVFYYDKQINQFSTFLNEARLSAIAIALYLAAIKEIPESKVQLLILDDVLLGIDLSNRLIILKILKIEFSRWQLILLTHDHVWYSMIKGYDPTWVHLELYQNEYQGIPTPILRPFSHNLVKAQEYYKQKDYSAAGFFARNALEDIIKKWVNDKQLELTIKAKTGQIFIDLEIYINAMKKYYKSRPTEQQITLHLNTITQFKNVVLNRLVHDTERTVFAHEVAEAINAIKELNQLLQKSSIEHIGGLLQSLTQRDNRIIIHKSIISLDTSDKLTKHTDFGIQIHNYIVPVQILDKDDETNQLYAFTNKTMITVMLNSDPKSKSTIQNVPISKTSLAILIHRTKIEILNYAATAKSQDDYSCLATFDLNASNSMNLLYDELTRQLPK